jgi:hypothetical protein
MKKFLPAILLSVCVSPAFSAPIIDVITGADMSGMDITANFEDGHSETLEWSVISTDAAVLYGEGYKGGVSSSSFSLTQQGYTYGNFVAGQPLGLWTLTNTYDSDLLSLVIDAMAGSIVFDTIEIAEVTPGSDLGRSFSHSDTDGVVVQEVYGDSYNAPDLWGSMTLYFADFEEHDTLDFLADTDKIDVPEPSTTALMLLGLAGLFVNRKRQQNS